MTNIIMAFVKTFSFLTKAVHILYKQNKTDGLDITVKKHFKTYLSLYLLLESIRSLTQEE